MDSLSSFGAFREEGYPTFYDELKFKFMVDVTLFRITSFTIAILISFIIILPGFRGKKKWFILFRWLPVILIGYLLVICNWMPFWESGQLKIRSLYRAGSNQQINASIGVYIGLRGLNVTLTGLPPVQNGDLVDYNEHFSWTWLQGRPGFGYDAGKLHQQYRNAQLRGLPFPILWIVETFTIDYGKVRIGRYYRQSGWYAHVFQWLAVPLFILAQILFQMVIQYGSLFMFFTGLSLLLSNLIMTIMRSEIPFRLAFVALESDENQFLVLHYSWCYYANLINGIICLVIGLVTLIADLRYPDEAADFFGNDILQSYEDYFADPQQKIGCQNNGPSLSSSGMVNKGDNEVMLRKRNGPFELEQGSSNTTIASGLKKRALSDRFSRFQKSTIRKVIPSSQVELRNKNEKQVSNDDVNQDQDQEVPLYENFQQFDTIGEESEL